MKSRTGSGRAALASALLHGALLLLFSAHLPFPSVRTRPAGTRLDAAIALSYDPGGAAPAALPTPAPARPARKARSAASAKPTLPVEPPRSASSRGSAGNSPLGDGDVSLALLRYAPDPEPDLSTLPHGTAGNVIVAVVIDAEGRIAESKLVQGLGESVDQTVLAAVQSWTFLPATRDGVAVASTREIVFHYEWS